MTFDSVKVKHYALLLYPLGGVCGGEECSGK